MTDPDNTSTIDLAEALLKQWTINLSVFFGVLGLAELAVGKYDNAAIRGRAVLQFVAVAIAYRVFRRAGDHWRDRAIARLESENEGE